MKSVEVIVVGAGAAGLMAACTLAKARKSVIVLEARSRTGGRIHTLDEASFFQHAELGAEFVHGNLPLTLQLLKDAGLTTEPAEGEMWRYENGSFNKNNVMDDNWDELINKLNELQEDVTLNAFLNRYFDDEKYAALRTSVIQYLGGYDTGDPNKASSFALRKEWQHEDEGAQHRVKEGYCALISYLVEQTRASGGVIYLNETAKKIIWQPDKVQLVTETGEQYQALQAVIALPLGVLQQPETAVAAITFEPKLAEQKAALQQIGFGELIKILLRFDEIFWEGEVLTTPAGGNLNNMAFLFSKEAVPTWWTQVPEHTPLLTGWLAGPQVVNTKHHTDLELLELALQSLSHIFNREAAELKAKLISWHVANWSADPYTCGSYAYDTVASPAARRLLCSGVEETLYFAGEYLYQGPAMGTVEAALMSGQQAAQHILKQS